MPAKLVLQSEEHGVLRISDELPRVDGYLLAVRVRTHQHWLHTPGSYRGSTSSVLEDLRRARL